MPPDSVLGRFFARTDTRAVASIASVILVGLTLQGFLLYAYIAMEALEEADRWLTQSIEALVPWIEAGEPVEAAIEKLDWHAAGELADGIRIRGADDRIEEAWGHWPTSQRVVVELDGDDSRDVGSWRLLRRENYLVGHAALPGGRTLDVSLSLAHAADEAGELRLATVLVAIGSTVLALVTAAIATIRAFLPLRRATALLREVDAQRLGRRLPTRSTQDPVDVHAETLNQVLAGIDAAFERLKAFSSDVAHELRTPLNRMINVSEVALLGGKEEEIRAALESVNATTHDLSRMVGALLLLAELAEGSLELPRRRISVAELVDRAVDGVCEPGEPYDVRVSTEAKMSVAGETSLLERALMNLLENALRYDGRVEVRAERDAGSVRILVDDDGPGVAAEDRARIFDRFTRLDTAGSPGQSGVGLALARAIARAHGGDVGVEDSPLLKGARFVLTLPAA